MRSTKHHLKRVIGSLLSFEELSTLLEKVELFFNSGPLLYTNDNDIDCINTLTTSYFLTVDVLISDPDVFLMYCKQHQKSLGAFTK